MHDRGGGRRGHDGTHHVHQPVVDREALGGNRLRPAAGHLCRRGLSGGPGLRLGVRLSGGARRRLGRGLGALTSRGDGGQLDLLVELLLQPVDLSLFGLGLAEELLASCVGGRRGRLTGPLLADQEPFGRVELPLLGPELVDVIVDIAGRHLEVLGPHRGIDRARGRDQRVAAGTGVAQDGLPSQQ